MPISLLLDSVTVGQLIYCRESTEHGDTRTIYAAPSPACVIVVMRHGLALKDLVSQVVLARISTAPAPAGIARLGAEGEPHTVVSVLKPLDGMADTYLGEIIDEANGNG